jgi:hypothetical protein
VYALLQGHISEHISFKARAQVLTMIMNEMPEVAEMQQTSPDQFVVVSESLVAERVQALTEELVEAEQGNQQQDPIVMLKQRELDLRAMDMQRKSQEFSEEEKRKLSEFDQGLDLDKMEREDSEASSKERIRVADDKLALAEKKLELLKSKGNK